tara:strand:- start:13325 stop:14260 length:936 start_codon:yes stop_codon:yes gene_type:complete
MDYNNLKGLDKAAVLLNVFGEPLFLSFFSGIPKEDLMQIRVRSNELSGQIPTVVRKQIIDEFSFLLLQDRYRKSKPDSDRLFQFLEDLSSEEIFYLLSNEPAPKAALAIDQVDDEKRSDFIDRLSPAQKNDIILELGNLSDVPLEMVVNVAKDLEKKAAHIPQSKEFSRGGGKRMADILNKMNEEEAAEYLNQVQTNDPDLYSDIKKYYLTFNDLLDMNEDTASDFWTNPDIDIDIFALSVKGVDEEKVKAIVDIMPKKKQAMYQPIEKPMPKKEVMDSRRELVNLAQTIINSGDMKIEDIIGGESQEMIE